MQTILLVEDNQDNRNVFRAVLEHGGYQVATAVTGTEGIELARRLHPDLILMDVHLPEVDGWEATRILKADPATADIPVIALTAYALARDAENSAAAGCDLHITKPIGPINLLERIREFLRDRS